MIRVTTGSRLHFGFVRILPAGGWDRHDVGAHSFGFFGGAGLMIQSPSVVLELRPAREWKFAGPMASRAADFARRFVAATKEAAIPPHSISILNCPPEHCGFGAGTQLAMAIASGLSSAAKLEPSVHDIALRLGRGARSAIGTFGHRLGGLIIDGGKSKPDELGPLKTRLDFPTEWRVILCIGETSSPWHGEHERSAIAQLSDVDSASMAQSSRLIEQAMVPAVTRRDFKQFGKSVEELNAISGDRFAAIQGGRFASPEIAARVESLKRVGAAGAGQSSWGPVVFGFAESEQHANVILAEWEKSSNTGHLVATSGKNHGATIEFGA